MQDQFHKFYYSSSPVGSGKTYKAALWLKANPTINVIYVAPTIKLCNEVKQRIDSTAGRVGQTRVINTETDNSGHSPRSKALSNIHSVHSNVGKTLVLTTTNFLNILARIQNPEQWVLIMDESFQPVDYEEFDSINYSHIVDEYFDVDECRRTSVKHGKKGILKAIYENRDFGNNDELSAPDLLKFVDAVMNPAVNLQLIKKDMGTHVKWHGYWYVTPQFFGSYKQAIFLSAQFEESLLYRIWENLFTYVDWVEHPHWIDESRNTHTVHGSDIRIGYLLNDNDNASITTYQKEVDGKRVIDHMVDIVRSAFDSPYILSLNNNMVTGSFPRAVKIPPMSYGIDEYKHLNNVASLVATNPKPEQLALIMPLVDEEEYTQTDIRNSFRRSTIYQNLGRCSLRDLSVHRARTILVASKSDAEYFHKLFEGSTLIGQVGDIPTVSFVSKFPKEMTETEKKAWRRANKPEDIQTWLNDKRAAKARKLKS